MSKVIKPLLVLAIVSCIIPAYSYAACSSDMAGVYTGGACSINELNKNLENEKAGSQVSLTKPQRNLRPVKNLSGMPKSNENSCLFGMCLFRTLIDGVQTEK